MVFHKKVKVYLEIYFTYTENIHTLKLEVFHTYGNYKFRQKYI